MKIVVCVKGVDFAYCASVVDVGTGALDPEATVYMLNPYDELAVEEALRIKEHFDDCEISLVTVGSIGSEHALRYACAMGGSAIDHLIRVEVDRPLDAWTTSRILAGVIRKRQVDVVLCGKKAIDTDAGQVGSFLAMHLDVAHVAGISRLSVESDSRVLVVERPLGRGDREEIECDLPALLTVDLGINEPRYPTLRNRLIAETRGIEVVYVDAGGDPDTCGGSLVRLKKHAAPRPKTRKVHTPDGTLPVSDRLQLLMSGPVSKNDAGAWFEGGADEAARHVLDLLSAQGFVPTNGDDVAVEKAGRACASQSGSVDASARDTERPMRNVDG